MPIQERPLAVRCAVACFFLVCIVGVLQGLSPATCSQRALIGAVCAYIGGRLVAKAMNAILMQAMVSSWVDQSKEEAGDQLS
jgi:hypothetical protein